VGLLGINIATPLGWVVVVVVVTLVGLVNVGVEVASSFETVIEIGN
jgi:hypothetical protein